MDQDTNRTISKKLVELTAFLHSLTTTDFAGRLHYKVTRTRRAIEFKENNTLDMGNPWPGDDDRPSSSMLAQFLVHENLARLADTSVARAIKDLDSPLKAKFDFVCLLSILSLLPYQT